MSLMTRMLDVTRLLIMAMTATQLMMTSTEILTTLPPKVAQELDPSKSRSGSSRADIIGHDFDGDEVYVEVCPDFKCSPCAMTNLHPRIAVLTSSSTP